jgi:polysaccharide biosynthesis protein PslH
MKILFVSRWFPFPPDSGSKKRIYHLIKALAETHTVDLISFTNTENTLPVSNHQIQSICRRVDTISYKPYKPYRFKALVGFLSRKPRFLVDTYQPEMAKLIATSQKAENYDLVIGTQIDMAPYIQPLQVTARLFEEIEIGNYIDRLSQQKGIIDPIRNRLTWWKLSEYLQSLLNSSGGMTTVSGKEHQYLTGISPTFKNVRVIPNGVDLDIMPKEDAIPLQNHLIFAGALTYQANFDAVNYFLSDIFPLILEEKPETKFYVTGNLNGVNLSRLPQRPGVVFTGYLEDISSSVARSWVSVVPLRIGGGTRIKILESLGIGTPVVTTSKGMEGLDLILDRDILVADTPASFAKQVLKVLNDAALRNTLSKAGRKQVQENYDWKKIGADFREYVEELGSHKTPFAQTQSLSYFVSK